MTCSRTKASSLGHALRGVHGPADPGAWPYTPQVYEAIYRAKIKSMTILTGSDIDAEVIDNLRGLGVQFIHARIFNTISVGEHKTGIEYVQAEEHSIRRLYDAGIRYFSIGNEPNLFSALVPEGFGVMWHNGAEFADWFLEAVDYLTPLFPDARWGFPAMSPGAAIPDKRYSGDQFLKEAWRGILGADFACQHTYWGFGVGEVQAIQEVADFANNTSKLVVVSEFGNGDPNVSKTAKGFQYVNFYELAKSLPKNVVSLDSWVLSSSSGFEEWTWLNSPIPDIVGAY